MININHKATLIHWKSNLFLESEYLTNKFECVLKKIESD